MSPSKSVFAAGGTIGVDPRSQRQLVQRVEFVSLELPGATAHDDAVRLLIAELIDLEGHVVVDRQSEKLAALGGPEDEAAIGVHRIVQRHDVHLVEQVEGQPPELLRVQQLPALLRREVADRTVLAHGDPPAALSTSLVRALPRCSRSRA